MGVVRSIVNLNYNQDVQGMTCVFLDYAQNHTGGTLHMLNIYTKLIVLICDGLWSNRKYGEYTS